MADIEVAGLVAKLSLDDSELNQSMASLNRQMKVAKSEFAAAGAGLDKFGKGTDGLKVKSEGLNKQLQIQGARVTRLQQEHAKSAAEKGEDAVQTQKLQVQLNNAIAEYNSLHGALQRVNNELAVQSSAWTTAGEALEKAGSRMQKIGKGMETAGQALSKNVTLPIVAAGGLALKASIDYESAFAGVRKTVNATEEELSKLSDGIRKMSKEIPTSATAIASVAEAAGQLGIQNENIIGFTRVMIDLGESTNLSAETAASSLAQFANITQMSQQDFGKLGSTIVALGNNMATTEADIVAMGMRLAGAGKQVGLTESQIMSFAAALSSVGIEAEAGGSAISRVFVDMQLATETGGQALKGFAKASGMSAIQFKKAFKEDAAGAMISFIKGLSAAEQRGRSAIKTLDSMGISEIRVRDALLRAAGAGDLFAESMELGTKAWKENTALAKEAEQRYKTTASKLEILKNKAVDIGITLGDAIVPALIDALEAAEPLIKTISDGARAFSEMDKGQQRSVLNMIGFAAAAGPALTMGGKLVGGIGTIAKVAGSAATWIGGLSTATTAAGTATATAAGGAAALGGGIAAMAGPLALGALAIAGVTVAGVALYKNLKKDAIPAVREFGSAVSEGTAEAVENFMTMYDDVDSSLKQLQWSGGKVTKETADTIITNFSGMADKVIESLNKSKNEGLAALNELFAKSSTISSEEQAEIISNLESGYNKRISIAEIQKAKIKEIMERASSERRALTKKEQKDIAQIQEDMKNAAINTMSESMLEQKAILERMTRDTEAYSARQAANVVEKAIEQRDKSVEAAEEQYNESIKQAILLRDNLKTITAEQADLLIKEAERQRDEAVKQAKDMHKLVVQQARLQAKEHVGEVDWETAQILTKWQSFKKKIGDLFPNSIGEMKILPTIPEGFFSDLKDKLLPFDNGGVVPGPIGAPRVVLAHGGETFIPTHKPGYQSNIEQIGNVTSGGGDTFILQVNMDEVGDIQKLANTFKRVKQQRNAGRVKM